MAINVKTKVKKFPRVYSTATYRRRLTEIEDMHARVTAPRRSSRRPNLGVKSAYKSMRRKSAECATPSIKIIMKPRRAAIRRDDTGLTPPTPSRPAPPHAPQSLPHPAPSAHYRTILECLFTVHLCENLRTTI